MRAEDRYGNRSESCVVEVRSLPHVNRPPEQRAPINDVFIAQAGKENTRRLELSRYFGDPDAGTFGDELTYALSSRNAEGVVLLGLEGTEALFEPVGIGRADVAVRVSDRAGETVESRFAVWVHHRSLPDVTIGGVGREHALSLPLAEYFHFADGTECRYAAESSDPSRVQVSIDREFLRLVPVGAGEATVEIVCRPAGGNSVGSRFLVTVTGGAGEGPVADGELLLRSNPVAEQVDIRMQGGAGRVAVCIYDAAARRVFEDTLQLDADGAGRLDVSALSPGVYSLVAERAGRRAVAGFVKR